MVIKLDRFARSLVDPELPSTSSERNVKLCLSDSISASATQSMPTDRWGGCCQCVGDDG
jgi:hypothetical protein